MVANMFLIQSLDLMVKISGILEKWPDQQRFQVEAAAARSEFQDEYVTKNGLVASDSQATYALAICFDLLKPVQRKRAATRLVELVRKNRFKIATGFAGTPYICEALASTGHLQIAYSMLLEKECPSWLYPVTMGATTVWERWDSMLPDGSINPGEMTSFNHYAFGAIAKFLYERVAGLQRTEPGWKACRIAPSIGARFSSASASHLTPNGRLSISWETSPIEGNTTTISIQVEVPPKTTAEVIIPSKEGERREEVGAGSWSFTSTFERDYEWPVLPLKPKS
jgi:alpha-L-rhamnosidase